MSTVSSNLDYNRDSISEGWTRAWDTNKDLK